MTVINKNAIIFDNVSHGPEIILPCVYRGVIHHQSAVIWCGGVMQGGFAWTSQGTLVGM